MVHFLFLKTFCIYETGYNGTIDGQGQAWWTKYKKRILTNTRGPLVQLMWSKDIVISNITLRNSPFWTLHPYDCKNVTISGITILAPVSGAPNTDGIDPGTDVLWHSFPISLVMSWIQAEFNNRLFFYYSRFIGVIYVEVNHNLKLKQSPTDTYWTLFILKKILKNTWFLVINCCFWSYNILFS